MPARDPVATRLLLLDAGQQEVYLRGFQAAALDDILRRAGVTKGAFFHHFASKADFGYALVDEVLADMIARQWIIPLQSSEDVLLTIADEFDRGADGLRSQRPILGCPLNNLAQEMSPLDAEFRARTSAVFDSWRSSFELALQRGQTERYVQLTVSVRDVAQLLVAQIEGILSLARNSQNPEVLTTGARALRHYLESLRDPFRRRSY